MEKVAKERRNLGGLNNIVFKKFNEVEKIQILEMSTKFVEGSNNLSSQNVAFINQFALGIKDDEALAVDAPPEIAGRYTHVLQR